MGFEPTSLLRDYLISSVVPRTDFSGNWAKIAPRIGSPREPSKPLVSRHFYPQSRIASRKIRTQGVSPKNGLKNGKKERIWREKREIRREFKPCSRNVFKRLKILFRREKHRSSAVGIKDERCIAWKTVPMILSWRHILYT